MATEALENRMAVVENELAHLKQRLAAEKPQTATAEWEKMFGIFADNEGFEEAVWLGREYREAQGPDGDEDTV